MSCPFKFTKNMLSSFSRGNEEVDTTLETKQDPFSDETKCPYNKVAPKEQDKNTQEEIKDNDNSDDEQQMGSGCPMRNTGKIIYLF
jgi:hypothetical protein